MPNQYTIPIASSAIFISLFFLERILSLRQPTRLLWRRLWVNLFISAVALAVAALLAKPMVASLFHAESPGFGLLTLFAAPGWVKVILGFLLLDLAFYYWHVVNHRIPILWRFHNVHHIDPDLDVSTAFRFHVGEITYSLAFRVAQVVLIGVSIEAYFIYEIAFTANTMFHHSNVRLPARLERWLNVVLVTPRMHGIHHSQVEREANSNYSVVLPWWDWLHRSLRLNVPQEQIKIGVPAYTRSEDNELWHLMSMPFRRQRDYWDSGEPTA